MTCMKKAMAIAAVGALPHSGFRAYPLPEGETEGVYTVKFEAEPGSIAGGVFDVRITQ